MKSLVELWRRWRSPGRKGVASSPAACKRRLGVEKLEDRSLPSSSDSLPAGLATSFGRVAQGPQTDVAAWSANNNHAFVDAEPQTLLHQMYFNSPTTYQAYVHNFQGVLRDWVAQADRQGITDDASLMQFLGTHLQAEFQKTRSVLAQMYPSQSDETYHLLMDMNLAHGYYIYATVPIANRSLYVQLHLHTSDCVGIAQLLQFLVKADGIPARQLVQSYHYQSALGPFIASHDVVYAGGFWLDAEINTAFRLNLAQLVRIPPNQRLESLFEHHRVYGFYDWYLQPQVRQAQLARGLDGGIIAFYYQYYLGGIGQGRTELTLENAL